MFQQLMARHSGLITLVTQYFLMRALSLSVLLLLGIVDDFTTLVDARCLSLGAFPLDVILKLADFQILTLATIWAAECCPFNNLAHNEVQGCQFPIAALTLSSITSAISTEEALARLALE